MSIQTAIENAQQKVANAYTAVDNKGGTLPATQDLANLPNAIGSISTGGTINSLNVTPSTSAQTITASGGVDGFSPVNVSAVDATIDSNIQSQYIKSGITILNVEGSLEEGITPSGTITISDNGTVDVTNYANASVEVDTVNNTTLNVNPSISAQHFEPTGDYTGYSEVDISAVTSAIDSNISANNIVAGKSILGVNGSATVLNGETKSVSLTNSAGQTFTPSSNKNAITSITVTPNNQARTVTPTTSQQTIGIGSGYSGNGTITVNAVDASIDPNVQAKYIRNGIDILGITGTYGEAILLKQLVLCGIYNLYIDDDNILYGCGNNAQLGQTGSTQTFTQIATNIKQVSFGNSSTWYITNDDILYGCGKNDHGQQGSGNTTNVTTFTQRATNVKKVMCSDYSNGDTTFYLTNDGILYSCGYNGYNTQGTSDTTDVTTFTQRATNVKDFVCSNYTTWYITNDDILYGCGRNNDSQQGTGNTTNVTTFTQRATNVKKVLCSDNTTWYITNDDILYGCGDGAYGQQGSNSTSDVTTFTQRATNVKDFVCSNYTTWYITNDDILYGCGRNYYGQQGSGSSGTTASYQVKTFTQRATNVKKVACCNETTWYIDNNNDLYGCGRNNYGQQGAGSTTDVKRFTKRGSNTSIVECNQNETWYSEIGGYIYGCGWNNNYQQGSGNNTNVTTFTKRN